MTDIRTRIGSRFGRSAVWLSDRYVRNITL
jgi:hypothetical protein